MRIGLDPRARLGRLVPRPTVYSALELLLLSLLAMQCARLVWTIFTPVGPIGEWRASTAIAAAPAPTGVLASFDPFFRLSGQSGPVLVTSLNLKLFGVRQDQASGRGSAIISTPDGQQSSFAVGDEIIPGVTLTGVGFDSVTISRNGASEQLFMDQSGPAQTVGTPVPTVVVPQRNSGGAVASPPSIAPPPPVQVVPAPPAPRRAPRPSQ